MNGLNLDIEHTHMSWPDDRAVPLAHHHVIAVLEPVRAGTVADTLLALLELFEQPEVARNCDGVCGARKDVGDKVNKRIFEEWDARGRTNRSAQTTRLV